MPALSSVTCRGWYIQTTYTLNVISLQSMDTKIADQSWDRRCRTSVCITVGASSHSHVHGTTSLGQVPPSERPSSQMDKTHNPPSKTEQGRYPSIHHHTFRRRNLSDRVDARYQPQCVLCACNSLVLSLRSHSPLKQLRWSMNETKADMT